MRSVLAPGLAAVRAYWRPFVLLQCAAFALVVAYYSSHHVRVSCEQLSDFKQRGGLIFSCIAAAVAGGLMPEAAKAIVLGDTTITRKRIRDVSFILALYAIDGIIVDLQYRLMALMFGTDAHYATVLKKALFDQLVTTPIFGTPYWIVAYLFRANRYNLVATFAQMSPQWYKARVIPLLIPCWFFWGPMVMLIYSLPGPLQFWMFCFASAAWSLLMVFVATHEAKVTASTPAA